MTEVLETVSLENTLRQLVQNGPLIYKSDMTNEAFDRFVLENGDLKIERDKYGTITIHPPMSFDSAHNEGEVFFFLKLWAKNNPHLGRALSPSASFYLLDGSQYKADGAWVSAKKVNELLPAERKKIPHIVPDFVIEVRSETDRIAVLKKKMEEVWIANGVQLAWLIDPFLKKAWIYRADGSTEAYESFNAHLYGEDILPGFVLNLEDLLSAES